MRGGGRLSFPIRKDMAASVARLDHERERVPEPVALPDVDYGVVIRTRSEIAFHLAGVERDLRTRSLPGGVFDTATAVRPGSSRQSLKSRGR